MEFFSEVMSAILGSSGFAAIPTDWRQLVMIVIACVLLYLGIGKGFEPLLLVPIAFGMLLANLPLTGLFAEPVVDAASHTGTVGFMWVIYQGVHLAFRGYESGNVNPLPCSGRRVGAQPLPYGRDIPVRHSLKPLYQ